MERKVLGDKITVVSCLVFLAAKLHCAPPLFNRMGVRVVFRYRIPIPSACSALFVGLAVSYTRQSSGYLYWTCVYRSRRFCLAAACTILRVPPFTIQPTVSWLRFVTQKGSIL